MSRTFRRPNAEQLVTTRGSKIAGAYTEVDRYEYNPLHGHSHLPIYREPTKVERYETWKRLHGEKKHSYHNFARGMNKWARREQHKEARLKNERLINNFLKWKTEDVVAYFTRRFPKQYW